jgi:hypothetical protein
LINDTKVIRLSKSFVLGFCCCGCGTEIPIRSKMQILQKFTHGHNFKNTKGENSTNFKNSRYVNSEGYVIVYRNSKLVKEHRWIYEQYYNCCLLSITQLHHIDGNRQNNSIENLEPVYNGIHKHKYHNKKIKIGFRLQRIS